jgi:tRNA (guanine-N7-)-methyltransferase
MNNPELPDSSATPNDSPAPAHPRGIRSFVLRQGRMSTAQTRAYETLGPQYLIPFVQRSPLDYRAAFGRVAPVVLEIGFGMGETSAKIAEARPETDFIGIEVHTPGVGSLLKRIDELKLRNQRIIQHDAVEVLEHMIAVDSLDGLHIYFPDPWPKKRHHKRRLIQPTFVRELAKRLKPGGYLHLATDWQEYAVHMLEVLIVEPTLRNTTTDYAPRPEWRPLTNFEKKGLAKGHGVWDLVFTRH